MPVSKTHLIFYVQDQARSTDFYAAVLASTPSLNVPGMTEFVLSDGCVLGLMPIAGINRLLGDRIKDPSLALGIPRAEIYLYVPDPTAYMERAKSAGATELSPLESRDWGDAAGYCADPDGHVIAFARRHQVVG